MDACLRKNETSNCDHETDTQKIYVFFIGSLEQTIDSSCRQLLVWLAGDRAVAFAFSLAVVSQPATSNNNVTDGFVVAQWCTAPCRECSLLRRK